MNEAALQRVLLARLNQIPGVECWRANTGAAMARGRRIHFGKKGQGDISGLIAPSGRRLEVEVKSDNGQQSPEQIAFQRLIESHGGLYVLAHDLDATLAIVAEAARHA